MEIGDQHAIDYRDTNPLTVPRFRAHRPLFFLEIWIVSSTHLLVLSKGRVRLLFVILPQG